MAAVVMEKLFLLEQHSTCVSVLFISGENKFARQQSPYINEDDWKNCIDYNGALRMVSGPAFYHPTYNKIRRLKIELNEKNDDNEKNDNEKTLSNCEKAYHTTIIKHITDRKINMDASRVPTKHEQPFNNNDYNIFSTHTSKTDYIKDMIRSDNLQNNKNQVCINRQTISKLSKRLQKTFDDLYQRKQQVEILRRKLKKKNKIEEVDNMEINENYFNKCNERFWKPNLVFKTLVNIPPLKRNYLDVNRKEQNCIFTNDDDDIGTKINSKLCIYQDVSHVFDAPLFIQESTSGVAEINVGVSHSCSGVCVNDIRYDKLYSRCLDRFSISKDNGNTTYRYITICHHGNNDGLCNKFISVLYMDKGYTWRPHKVIYEEELIEDIVIHIIEDESYIYERKSLKDGNSSYKLFYRDNDWYSGDYSLRI